MTAIASAKLHRSAFENCYRRAGFSGRQGRAQGGIASADDAHVRVWDLFSDRKSVV